MVDGLKPEVQAKLISFGMGKLVAHPGMMADFQALQGELDNLDPSLVQKVNDNPDAVIAALNDHLEQDPEILKKVKADPALLPGLLGLNARPPAPTAMPVQSSDQLMAGAAPVLAATLQPAAASPSAAPGAAQLAPQSRRAMTVDEQAAGMASVFCEYVDYMTEQNLAALSAGEARDKFKAEAKQFRDTLYNTIVTVEKNTVVTPEKARAVLSDTLHEQTPQMQDTMVKAYDDKLAELKKTESEGGQKLSPERQFLTAYTAMKEAESKASGFKKPLPIDEKNVLTSYANRIRNADDPDGARGGLTQEQKRGLEARGIDAKNVDNLSALDYLTVVAVPDGLRDSRGRFPNYSTFRDEIREGAAHNANLPAPAAPGAAPSPPAQSVPAAPAVAAPAQTGPRASVPASPRPDERTALLADITALGQEMYGNKTVQKLFKTARGEPGKPGDPELAGFIKEHLGYDVHNPVAYVARLAGMSVEDLRAEKTKAEEAKTALSGPMGSLLGIMPPQMMSAAAGVYDLFKGGDSGFNMQNMFGGMNLGGLGAALGSIGPLLGALFKGIFQNLGEMVGGMFSKFSDSGNLFQLSNNDGQKDDFASLLPGDSGRRAPIIKYGANGERVVDPGQTPVPATSYASRDQAPDRPGPAYDAG